MRTRWGALLLGMGLFSACTVLPTGPSVLVLPTVGKPMDVFQAEEGECRAYAQQQLGAAPEQTAALRLQGWYDRSYVQCMYAKGNVVPGAVVVPGPSVAPVSPGPPSPPPSPPALPPPR
jgi:hypothetical protein